MLGNVRRIRTLFSASRYPISCWHADALAGDGDNLAYRFETLFHARLHGEQWRNFYNAQILDAGGSDEEIERYENLMNDALLELDAAVPFQEVFPLSVDYAIPSMQNAEFIVSGAALPGGTRLFRITLRDADPGASGTATHAIGPVAVGAGYVDFQTRSGNIVRMPGHIASPGVVQYGASDFKQVGWWLSVPVGLASIPARIVPLTRHDDEQYDDCDIGECDEDRSHALLMPCGRH
jgi:hypothetical protein